MNDAGGAKGEGPTTPPGSARDLTAALRRARLAQAERSDVIVDLRAAELARLELLRDEVAAVMRQVPPEHTSLFDGGLVPGYPPRLWIDILTFVEMARDKRTYRFLRDTREGRTTLHETLEPSDMTDRITDYVAHRIIERERAIAEERGPTGLPSRAAEAPERTVVAVPPRPIDVPVPAGRPVIRPPSDVADMATWGRGPQGARAPAEPAAAPPPPALPVAAWEPVGTQARTQAPAQETPAQLPAFAVPPQAEPAAPAADTSAPTWGRPQLKPREAATAARRRRRPFPVVAFLSGMLTATIALSFVLWLMLGRG